jgi:hypothetical protein
MINRLLATAAVLAVAAVALAQVVPYEDPPFRHQCVVHHYEEHEAPPLDVPDDPLCVEFEKRDITASNGGAVRFLAAEPARFALAVQKCRYWQQDHWRIQVQPGTGPLIGWDGSYWFDRVAGTGGAITRNFTVGGQPADAGQVAAVIGLVDPELAAVISQYGAGPSGGGGASFALGFNDPTCLGERLLNHFQCYGLKPPSFVARPGVALADRFGAGTVDVQRPVALCNPADKNDEDESAPADPDHLVAYRIRQRSPAFTRRNGVTVADQFGTFVFDVVKPTLLLVPSAKSHDATPPAPSAPAVDHFKCYKLARARGRIDAVKVDDQFGTLTLDLGRPLRLCVPADKNGEGIQDAAALLLCHKARVRRGTSPFTPPAGTIFTNNQLGGLAARVVKPGELCIPALLDPAAAPATPTPVATP